MEAVNHLFFERRSGKNPNESRKERCQVSSATLETG